MSYITVPPPIFPVIGEAHRFMGGPFAAFDTGRIHGLAWVHDLRIDILAISAHVEGRGDAGRFLEACKREFSVIGVWEIWNPKLAAMLDRRGFHVVKEVVDGDLCEGMVWRRLG